MQNMKIKVFTKAVVDDINVGNITTFYNDGESEVLSADLLGVDPTGVDVEMNYFGVNIESGVVKAWKRHRQMTLNLVVSVGVIRFVMFDDRHVYAARPSKPPGSFPDVC